MVPVQTPHASAIQTWLRIRGASVRKGERGGRTILHRLCLELHEGEHTAILGANGSGKSSLLKMITQEYRPLARQDGEPAVEIFGRSRWDVFELRSLLGIVSADLQRDFLDAAMLAALRGLEVAVSGFFSSQAVFPHHAVSVEMREQAREALTAMGAEYLKEKLLREMSTGEQRRALIARALVSDPRVLLLDEPTAGLDMVARHRFLDTIRALARRGKTVVFVTHRLEEIIPEVSRVILLRDGRVYWDGPVEVVLSSEHLSEAFGARLELHRSGEGYHAVHVPG